MTEPLGHVRPVPFTRSSEYVAAEIRASILRGDFDDYDRLPLENEFAEAMGVSRHVMREALRLLERDGLVRVRSGRNGGVFLRTPSVDVLTNAVSAILTRRGTTLEDVIAARLVIEPAAAGLAAIRAASTDLDELQRVLDEQQAARESANATPQVEADLSTRFHLGVTEAAGNQTLVLMTRSIESLTRNIENAMRALANPSAGRGKRTRARGDLSGLREDSVKAHAAILRALRERDAERATDLVRSHIVAFEDRLKRGGLDPAQATLQDVARLAIEQRPLSQSLQHSSDA